MSEDTKFIARQLLGHLLGDDQAAGLAEPILTGLLTDALALADRLAGGKDASGSWLDRAFGLGGATGAGRPFRLAELLVGFVPADVREEIARLLRGAPPPTAPSSAPNAPPAGPPRLRIDDLIRRLTDLPGGGPAGALAVTTLSGLHDDLWQLAAGATRSSSSKWNPQSVVRRIRQLIQRWLRQLSNLSMPGVNTRRVAAEIEAELLGPFEERLFVASGLTIGGLAAYGVADLADLLLGRPSTMLIGTEVHQVLQEQYRTEPTRFSELIVQESYVYTRGVPQPLQKAALRNPTLLALWTARDSYLLKVRNLLKTGGPLAQEVERSLRDDNINLTTGAIWEIKPIRGAFLGVVQEFTYRTFFNFYVALLKDIPGLSGLPVSGPLSFIREHLDPGDIVRWPEIVSSPVRRIGGGASRFPEETILVMMLDPLPGLVLYLRLDLPLAAVYALATYIRKLLNELAKRLKRAFDVLVTTLVFAIAVVLVILLAVVLVFALVEVGVALADLLGAAALVLAPLLARLGIELPRLVEIIRRLAEQIAPLREQYGLGVHTVPSVGYGHLCLRFTLNADTPADAVPRASAMLGMLRLEDAPVEILSSMAGVFVVAGALGGALVLQRLAAQA